MHPRQRSPGNGYRSMGYASEYRHANRDGGFGRGHGNPKGFSHKGDVFMEAGRLAAQYLVSQGLLPPNVLSLRWHNNSSFKKHGDFRPHDGDAVQVPLEGRTSALARLGNTIPDGPSGRRKVGADELSHKGRRRGAGFRSNGFDWGRGFKRSGSWSDRPSRASPDIRDNDDAVTRQQDVEEHQQVVVGGGDGVDNVLQKSSSNEFAPKSEDGNNLDTETDKDRVSSELDLKTSSSGAAKDTCSTDVEFVQSSNGLENMSAGVMEVKDGTCHGDTEKSSISKSFSVTPTAEENHTSMRVCTDLLTLCKSVKVPTRTRTSLTHRNLKVDRDPHPHNGEENTNYIGDLEGPEVSAESEYVKDSPSGDLVSDKSYNLAHLDSEIGKVEPVHAVDNVKELDTEYNAEEAKSMRSPSGAKLPEYESFGSMVEDRGEKRAAGADAVREETKRMREWLPCLVPRTEDYFLRNNPIGMKGSSKDDEISPIDEVTMTSAEGSLMSNPQFTKDGDRPLLQCTEEKQSLPSSFRTCDLNLIEASEVHENQGDHLVLIYPPVSETKKGTVPVDIDLSRSHASVSGKFSTHAASGKEIEIIDLENDSTQEVMSVDNMEGKTETMFPGLDGFSNHAQNTADIHDVQDGYGLMLSELLGTDFPNCSSVPGDINSVHNEMGLHNGTGTLGEDDSIYMSLGEIPLSFLRGWEQPPSQEYEKHF